MHRSQGALAYCAILLFFFAAQRRHALWMDWLGAGAADARRILAGEWWRAITTLALHTEFGHLTSNLAFGVVISLLVAALFGSGLAWLAVLLAGALGNALDALLHPAGQIAIGASTAWFGALGILSGHARQSRVVPWRGGLRRWEAPIGAGIMLLAFLGFGGERTTVWVHVAGFAVGVVIGFALAFSARRVPRGGRAQSIYGALACGLFALARLLALRAEPILGIDDDTGMSAASGSASQRSPAAAIQWSRRPPTRDGSAAFPTSSIPADGAGAPRASANGPDHLPAGRQARAITQGAALAPRRVRDPIRSCREGRCPFASADPARGSASRGRPWSRVPAARPEAWPPAGSGAPGSGAISCCPPPRSSSYRLWASWPRVAPLLAFRHRRFHISLTNAQPSRIGRPAAQRQ